MSFWGGSKIFEEVFKLYTNLFNHSKIKYRFRQNLKH